MLVKNPRVSQKRFGVRLAIGLLMHEQDLRDVVGAVLTDHIGDGDDIAAGHNLPSSSIGRARDQVARLVPEQVVRAFEDRSLSRFEVSRCAPSFENLDREPDRQKGPERVTALAAFLLMTLPGVISSEHQGRIGEQLVKALPFRSRERGKGHADRRAHGYVWVRENGDDKGAHVHIYWRGPVEFPDLRSRLGSWIRAVGGKRRKGVFHTRPVGLTLAHANSGGRTYDLELDDALDYALKGAGPEARAAYGIRRDEPGRPMTGKRWGRSRNLGGSDFSLTVKEQSKRIETPQPVLR